MLSNANKFSPAGGHISIAARADNGCVIVEVKDSAQVITEENRIRIFDPYFRAGSTEEQSRISGLGLGLAIAKSLIVLQKGEIGVNCDKGEGNTFFFTLPIWSDEDIEDGVQSRY